MSGHVSRPDCAERYTPVRARPSSRHRTPLRDRNTTASTYGLRCLVSAFCAFRSPAQLLRLAVRQQERTVDQELLAVDLAAPRARVARDGPAPALDLDEVDLVERHHEQIDFVDAAVLGDELEVRPRAERLAVRQAGLQVVEGLALPGVFGGGDLDPAGGFHCRSIGNSSRARFRSRPRPGLGGAVARDAR